MKKVALLVAGCFLLASVVEAATEDVWLLPAKPGKKSEIIKGQPQPTMNLGDKPTVDMWLIYDRDHYPNPPILLSGISDVETTAVWFQSPAKCSVLAFQFWAMSYVDSTQDSCNTFGVIPPDTFDPDDYGEYHSQTFAGPSPCSLIFVGPHRWTGINPLSRGFSCCTLTVSNPPDVGKGYFLGGYSKQVPDSSPNPGITGGFEPDRPRHSLLWRSNPSGGGPPGWYCSHHLQWIVAQIRMYENPPPVITRSMDKTDTYKIADIWISNDAKDLGVPSDSLGVMRAYLIYYVNPPDTTFTDSVPMTLVSGDSSEGTWAGPLAGPFNVADTITYTTVFIDYQEAVTQGPTCSFIIREGTTDNALVIISRSEYYGEDTLTPDPWANISSLCPHDLWLERAYGAVDSSVLYFYKDGPGKKAIFVHTWGADPIRSDSSFFAEFLDAGGGLAISSQDMIGHWAGNYDTTNWGGGTFVHDYLKVNKVHDDYHAGGADSVVIVSGIPPIGNPPLDEFRVYPYNFVGPGYNYIGIFLDVDPACSPVFIDVDGYYMGYTYESSKGYKIANIYFPFQYIWSQATGQLDTVLMDTLAARLYEWTVGIEEAGSPLVYMLSRATPNPAGAKTSITYAIPISEKVSLKVYDVTGSLVRTLVDEVVKPGTHTVAWDGRDSRGKLVRSGLYFYKLESGNFSKAQKLVLIR